MISDVALLNDPEDLDIAKKLLAVVKEHKDNQAHTLLTTYMERDSYSRAFGAHQELSNLLSKLEEIYNRAVNV